MLRIMKREGSVDTDRDQGVLLTGRDIEDAKRLLSLLAADEAELLTDSTIPAEESGTKEHERLARKARKILAYRRLRQDYFGKAMLGEPAWEIMLLLYATEPAHAQTISRLAELSGSSRSTALRWIDYLENRQLVRREAHPSDKRAALVELSPKGRDSLEVYLSRVV